jgi:phosphoglycolate phosphatase-like HAD superfamily hydrolase
MSVSQMKIDKIYLDMDGVICDFMKRYKEMFKHVPRRDESTAQWHKNFEQFIKTKQFETLDLEPGAESLIEFLKKQDVPVEILSSTALPKFDKEISKQKEVWLKEHNIDFKRNFVPGKSLKYKFATPTSLIIDDTLSVIDDWKEAGGPAIQHKNARETIVMLKLYLMGEK